MKKIITLLSVLTFCSFTGFGQGYGEILYPHSGGSKMSCAFTSKLHPNQPGYLMAGFEANSKQGGYNFVIDRTSGSGLITNQSWVFQKEYHILADITQECNYKLVPIESCVGVSVIETDGPPNTPYPLAPPLRYALAGAFNEGCFFALLDNTGSPLYSTSFIFPDPPYTTVTKPNIVECSRTPGDYIVSGSIDNLMYAFRINSVGNVIWSHFYPIVGTPNDMIESPYGNPGTELVVVGKTEMNAVISGQDGFAMKINIANGAVNNFTRIDAMAAGYNTPFGNQYFTSICLAPRYFPTVFENGFKIAGYTEPGSWASEGHAWVYSADTSLFILDSYYFTPSSDTLAGEIVDIQMRKKPNSIAYEYYSLIKSDVGMIVIRTDGSLFNPFFNLPYYRESVYTVPGQISEPCALGCVEDLNRPDAGIQVFGIDDRTKPNSHYLAKAYYSGESGCSYTTTPFRSGLATGIYTLNISPYGGLTPCRNFSIYDSENAAFNEICGPYVSINNASNARSIAVAASEEGSPLIETHIFPNPTSEKATVTYVLTEDGSVKLDLYNALGQHVTTLQNGNQLAGKHSVEINLNSLGLENGVYLLNTSINGMNGSYKFIYNGK